MGKKVYFGQIGKLKKDKIEEYETLHANTWPHIRELIRECNLVNYSISAMKTSSFPTTSISAMIMRRIWPKWLQMKKTSAGGTARIPALNSAHSVMPNTIWI